MDVRSISYKRCIDTPSDDKKAFKLDLIRSRFIVTKQFTTKAGSRRLGVLWLVLDPLITTLIYLFVFTVIRYNPNLVGLFIGLTMCRGLQQSLKDGVKTKIDFSGGMRIERIRTRALILSEIFLLIFNTIFMSIGTSLILIFAFNVPMFGIIMFIFAMFVNNVVWYGLGKMLSPVAIKIPDIETLVSYFGILMFFMSPCLYELGSTKGIHRTINLYNPFSFTVEWARKMGYGSEGFEILNPLVGIIMFTVLFFIFILGLKRIDALRWRLSTWS